jgi:hypothetical protein
MTDMILSKGTPTNFELAIPRLPSMTEVSEVDKIVLHLHETVIPNSAIDTIPRHYMGVQVDEQPGHNIQFDDWEINFTVDSQLSNWRALWDWMNYITAVKEIPVTPSYINPKDHMIDCSLIITDNFKNPIFNIRFTGVWIQRLGEVRFTNRDGEQILESTATLKYYYFEIKDIEG